MHLMLYVQNVSFAVRLQPYSLSELVMAGCLSVTNCPVMNFPQRINCPDTEHPCSVMLSKLNNYQMLMFMLVAF